MYGCFSRQDPQRGFVPSLQVYERATLPPCVSHQGQLLVHGGQKRGTVWFKFNTILKLKTKWAGAVLYKCQSDIIQKCVFASVCEGLWIRLCADPWRTAMRLGWPEPWRCPSPPPPGSPDSPPTTPSCCRWAEPGGSTWSCQTRSWSALGSGSRTTHWRHKRRDQQRIYKNTKLELCLKFCTSVLTRQNLLSQENNLTGHAWRKCLCPCPADPTEQWTGWSCCRPCWHWIWPLLWSSCGRDPAAPWRQPDQSDPSPESGSAGEHLRGQTGNKERFVGVRWNSMQAQHVTSGCSDFQYEPSWVSGSKDHITTGHITSEILGFSHFSSVLQL